MANLSGSDYIYRMGTAPNTRAAVTQKNRVLGYTVGKKQICQFGAISEFGFDESRTIDPIRGVGFGDMIAELVPGVTEPMTLTLNKTLLYAQNLFQLVGYKGGIDGLVRSLRHHRWPFDIKQELVFSELASSESTGGTSEETGMTDGAYKTAVRVLGTFYEGCWFNSYSASFTSDAAIVAENSSVTVTDILDADSLGEYGEYIDSGLAPISAVGSAGTGYSIRFGSPATPTVGAG
jgi:hypothetical protein